MSKVRQLRFRKDRAPVQGVHQVQRTVRTASASTFAEPAHERIRLLHVPKAQESVGRKGGVSQPSIAVVPVANAADLFRQPEG